MRGTGSTKGYRKMWCPECDGDVYYIPPRSGPGVAPDFGRWTIATGHFHILHDRSGKVYEWAENGPPDKKLGMSGGVPRTPPAPPEPVKPHPAVETLHEVYIIGTAVLLEMLDDLARGHENAKYVRGYNERQWRGYVQGQKDAVRRLLPLIRESGAWPEVLALLGPEEAAKADFNSMDYPTEV